MVDCLYNPETEFWAKDIDKEYAQHLILYKFWKNQVSKSMIILFVLAPMEVPLSWEAKQLSVLRDHVYEYTTEGLLDGNKR